MNEVVKLLQECLERMENGIRWEQEAQAGAIIELDARSCAQETTLQTVQTQQEDLNRQVTHLSSVCETLERLLQQLNARLKG